MMCPADAWYAVYEDGTRKKVVGWLVGEAGVVGLVAVPGQVFLVPANNAIVGLGRFDRYDW